MLACRLLIFFFKINFLKSKSFSNSIRVSNSLDPDQDRPVGPVWVQTVCKGYQQRTLVGKELVSAVSYSEARETLDIKRNPCAYIVSMLNPDIYCFEYSVDPDNFLLSL